MAGHLWIRDTFNIYFIKYRYFCFKINGNIVAAENKRIKCKSICASSSENTVRVQKTIPDIIWIATHILFDVNRYGEKVVCVHLITCGRRLVFAEEGKTRRWMAFPRILRNTVISCSRSFRRLGWRVFCMPTMDVWLRHWPGTRGGRMAGRPSPLSFRHVRATHSQISTIVCFYKFSYW